ncbi:hypothetical protein [Arthrobacter sp.]|uniref:hypothetical protein n=1 Tax=Arthrobacter sp. TaxID=1667 RepID=UPI003A93D077
MYLADREGLFHFIGIDLDAKTDAQARAAGREALLISQHLEACRIEHVVCESGATGGRHVWIALAEPMPHEPIMALRHALKLFCTTLDLGSLTNASTGCLRPPGSPHRDGSHSEVLKGALDALLNPTTTPGQVNDLTERLETVYGRREESPTPPQTSRRTPTGITLRAVAPQGIEGQFPKDQYGHIYLPGVRRGLPAGSAAALASDTAGKDASAILWTVALGAARSCWHLSDLAELVDSSPGMEFIRTKRTRGTSREANQRTARSAAEARRQLEWTWNKAVRRIASGGTNVGDDPELETRREAMHEHVQALQDRANAANGRWDQSIFRSGPTDRRILDALCLLTLQAIRTDVEADIRRLGTMAGIGRETARVSLLRLEADGWIAKADDAEGIHGARWTIDPQEAIHKELDSTRSQGGAAPRRLGISLPSTFHELLDLLEERLSLSAHDCFTGVGSFPHEVGNVYAALSLSPGATPAELMANTGLTAATLTWRLEQLADVGLAASEENHWVAAPAGRRDKVSQIQGTSGMLEARANLYRLERELWDWWQAEHVWMGTPRKAKKQHRAGPGQLTLITMDRATLPAHPRHANGRADYATARRILGAGGEERREQAAA